jgi:PTH1 family peptidyl-tRNA hydrolase
LGIGHPGHKDAVAGFVLHDFSKADRAWLDPLMDGISDGAAALASGDPAGFLNLVALRVSPPRKVPRATPEAVAPAPSPSKPLEDPAPSPLNALQKLVQKFRS